MLQKNALQLQYKSINGAPRFCSVLGTFTEAMCILVIEYEADRIGYDSCYTRFYLYELLFKSLYRKKTGNRETMYYYFFIFI